MPLLPIAMHLFLVGVPFLLLVMPFATSSVVATGRGGANSCHFLCKLLRFAWSYIYIFNIERDDLLYTVGARVLLAEWHRMNGLKYERAAKGPLQLLFAFLPFAWTWHFAVGNLLNCIILATQLELMWTLNISYASHSHTMCFEQYFRGVDEDACIYIYVYTQDMLKVQFWSLCNPCVTWSSQMPQPLRLKIFWIPWSYAVAHVSRDWCRS